LVSIGPSPSGRVGLSDARKVDPIDCEDNPLSPAHGVKSGLKMRDLFDGVTAFVAVARRRSFSAAARELGVTPAAVSWTIKQLEARTGAPLFARTTRDVALTEAGRAFLEHAAPGVQAVSAGLEAVQALSGRPSGRLRLNIPSVAQGMLEPLIPEFCAVYPEVELELFVEDRLANIVEDGFDAGIRIGEMIAADMVAVRLTPPARFAISGSPAFFARHGRPERPEDLRRFPCVNFRQSARGGLYRWEFEEGGRDLEVAVSGPLIVNGSTLMLSACVAGVGLAYTMSDVITPLTEAGLLETCLDPFMPENPGFFVYFPSRDQVAPKLRAFIDFATARLR
jgi:DNA-binding transcriptional LysR family regulator